MTVESTEPKLGYIIGDEAAELLRVIEWMLSEYDTAKSPAIGQLGAAGDIFEIANCHIDPFKGDNKRLFNLMGMEVTSNALVEWIASIPSIGIEVLEDRFVLASIEQPTTVSLLIVSKDD